MNLIRKMKMFGVIVTGIWTVLMVLFSNPVWSQEKIIKIDGSSTVYPITEAVAEEFQKAKRGTVKVTVGISGTGGGFKKFSRGDTDISDASRPIVKKEMDACKEAGIEYIELPVAYDGIAVMVNPRNNWVTSMTPADLKKIWEPAAEGKVTRWNQVNPKWPDVPLKLYGPGVDSGTFDYFTEAIVGKSRASRGDFTASEDDNVLVQGIATDRGALGFFGYAYYAENTDKLKIVPIDAGKGLVTPSENTIMGGTYEPLSRPIFIYVNKKAAERPEVKEFVEFYLKHAPKLVKQVKYVPLPDRAYKLSELRFARKVSGTVFGGEAKIGMKIEDLLKLEEKK
jgi:phosphate transport system substrate-binding protein